MKSQKTLLAGLVVAVLGLLLPAVAFASLTPNLTQQINNGTSFADILDSSRAAVASPSFALTASNFSFDCQTVTGSLGDNNQRLYVTALNDHPSGYTLAIAATSGATATWSAGTPTYDFNDPTSSGCTDGADSPDTRGGQLTIDANAGTLTTDCGSCSTTGITKGSSTAFNQGTTDSITLLNAGGTSDDTGRWYLTGATLSQKVPAEQATGSYTLGMTLTYTGL